MKKTPENNLLSDAIKKQSRLLDDIEVIDTCDIIMGESGYTAVPNKIVGKRRIDIGHEQKPRRWYGLMTELNRKEKENDG